MAKAADLALWLFVGLVASCCVAEHQLDQDMDWMQLDSIVPETTATEHESVRSPSLKICL